MRIKTNEKIQKAFGENYSFASITNEGIKGFYLSMDQNGDTKNAHKVYDSIIEGGEYIRIFEYTRNLLRGTISSLRFGSTNGNLEIAISYSKPFEKKDKVIVLGELDDNIEVYFSNIKKAFSKSAYYNVGKLNPEIDLFFKIFTKAELKTLSGYRLKLRTFKEMENFLTEDEELLLLKLVKKHCMTHAEATKEDGFFKKLFA